MHIPVLTLAVMGLFLFFAIKAEWVSNAYAKAIKNGLVSSGYECGEIKATPLTIRKFRFAAILASVVMLVYSVFLFILFNYYIYYKR